MHTVHILASWRVADMSCYQDADNNTILTLLADFKPSVSTPYRSTPDHYYASEAALRMAKLYYDRYPYTRDWANAQGKTALHGASMRGNEEIVRVCNSPAIGEHTLLKRYSGGPDHARLTNRCYVISVRTLT